MQLNIDKCKVMSYTRNRCLIEGAYGLNGKQIEEIYQIKDLGVIFDSKLTCTPHIDYIVNKSLRKLGYLKRHTTTFKDISTIVILYKTLIKPILMYASTVWSPNYADHMKRIESVQHKFFSYASYKAKIQNPLSSKNGEFHHQIQQK